jgi:hypothetical protein
MLHNAIMIINRLLLLMVGLVLLLPRVSGQVSVEVVFDQEQYLPNEPLNVGVRITNLSGQTLRLGKSKDWLQYKIDSHDSSTIVSKEEDPPVDGEFLLESSKVATKTVNIAPYFNLTRVGRFWLSAVVRIDQWNQLITSPEKSFDIISGVVQWRQAFGVPAPDGATDTAPETRVYLVQKATYLKQLRLYVRVTDAHESYTYRVLSLGNTVSFGQPEAQVDRDSNLHVLNQNGPRSFVYCMIDPNGAMLIRQAHDYTPNSRPILKPAPDGKIRVIGGARRLSSDDIPPHPTPTLKPTTNTNAPAQQSN